MAGASLTGGAGFDSIQVSKRSSAGYATGRAGLTSANTNTYSEAYRVVGANAVPVSYGTRANVNLNGDDLPLAQFSFAPTSLPSFDLTLVTDDFTFDTLISGLSTLALGDATVSAGVPSDQVSSQLITLISRQSQSLDTATTGDAQWDHRLILNCQIEPQDDNFAFQAAASATHKITVSNSKRTAWGQLISSAFTGASQSTILKLHTQNRLTFGAYVGNNASTTFTVLQTPVGATYAKAFVESGSGTNTFAAGTITDITGKVVTLSAAPASGAFVIIFYEFADWE